MADKTRRYYCCAVNSAAANFSSPVEIIEGSAQQVLDILEERREELAADPDALL